MGYIGNYDKAKTEQGTGEITDLQGTMKKGYEVKGDGADSAIT